MKVWLSGVAALLLAQNAQAEDYRVVYSPSLALEVWIDNVASKAPDDWCKETLPLRIVSGKSSDTRILTSFLPRVGTLLANQCGTLDELPWQMTTKEGSVLANGSAAKLQNWRPIILNDATASASSTTAAPLDLSRPADNTPLQHFALPGGCHFRTWWDDKGASLFIPDAPERRCSTEGWLEGAASMTLLSKGGPATLPVVFYQGYPVAGLAAGARPLEIVAVNKQRMIVTRPDAAGSWLVLPFDAREHVWRFSGALLIQMDKKAGSESSTVKAQVDRLRGIWSPQFMPQQKVTVLLIDTLHADLADPAIGAWRNIN
ncbi:MAG: hypothetical protein K0S95_2148 [Pantoea eucrina]|jgi:hypothetical protein|uniref:hypothetical protein n=1 Tax=Pantoea TaxID=53335 RepID=UPI00080F59BD|nr:hypothetical protein [Pantoea eucrina]MDF2785613.1 hypothetical protein [Pantoea eucrina]